MRYLISAFFLVAILPQSHAQLTGPINLRPPGSGGSGGISSQFYQSSVATSAAQLTNELNLLATEIIGASMTLQVRSQINTFASLANNSANAFAVLALSTGDRARLIREFAVVDTHVTNYLVAIQRLGISDRSVAQGASRVRYAQEQLNAVMQTSGGNFPNLGGHGNWPRRVIRLCNALAEQSEELRALAGDVLPDNLYERNLDRAIRSFSIGATKLEENVQLNPDVTKLRIDYTELARRWNVVTTQLTPLLNQNALVRQQAARVDALFRELNVVVLTVGGGSDNILPPIGIIRNSVFVVGAGEGGGPRVRVFPDLSGTSSFDFFAYDPKFRGGVRVAVADLNGDKVPDIITAPGPGMEPLVRVFDGSSLRLITEFLAFDRNWIHGVNIAAADITRRGKAMVAVAADRNGGPHVRVFDLSTGTELDSFFPYPKEFTGGVRLAMGDFNGDGIPDLATAPGPGMAPTVVLFDGRNRKKLNEFQAFDARWQNGVNISAADLNRNGRAEIICGADAGGGPHVRVIDGIRGNLIYEFFPYNMNFSGGVRVSAMDVNGDGVLDVITSPGPTQGNLLGGAPIRVFDGTNRRPLGEFFPFERNFKGGAYVNSR